MLIEKSASWQHELNSNHMEEKIKEWKKMCDT
jgi:hypothetical protein